MSDNFINVALDYTDETGTGTEHFWAVRAPEDVLPTPEGKDVSLFPEGFRIFGGNPVVVYDKQSIEGIRALLDEIEGVLNDANDS